MKKSFYNYILCSAIALSASVVTSCDDYMDGSTWTASSELQMDEYMESQPDLSMFLEVVDQAKLRGMIHAYGTYTMFVPNNDAVASHLKRLGKSSVQELTEDEAVEIVKYHVLGDTLHTSDMQANTRLRTTNMSQDYLITKWNEASDVYTLNRTSRITRPDVHNGNGIIHVVDGLLFRPEYMVLDAVRDSLQEHGYGIMANLLDSVLNQYLSESVKAQFDSILAAQNYMTFLAQPDKLMESDGITSVEALVNMLQKSNIKDYSVETMLVNWVGYHFMKGRYYISDLFGASSVATLSPLGKAIAVSASSYSSIHLNRFEAFNDEGIDLITDGYFVDYACNNGVIQSTSGELQIIERAASRINWDMADVAEIRALSNFRKAGCSAVFTSPSSSAGPNADHPEWVVDSTIVNADGNKVYWFDTELSSTYSWFGTNNPVVNYWCGYETDKYTHVDPFGDTQIEWVYGDNLQFRLATHVVKQMDIKTPTLVEGTYKVWVRLRRAGDLDKGFVKTTFIQDGQPDQNFASVCFSAYGPNSDASNEGDEKLAAKGEQGPGAYYPRQSRMACHMIGIINVKNDGVHILRWTPLDGNRELGQYFDMLYFIPVDQNQVLPRVMANGEDARVYKVCWDEETQSAYYDKSVYWDVSGFNSTNRSHIWPNRCPVVEAMEEGTITEDKIGSCTHKECPNYQAQ